MASTATQASQSARAMAGAVSALTGSIGSIADSVAHQSSLAASARVEATSSEAAVRGLAVRTGDIEAFVGAVGTIASRTNLLALNATIEAARAGAILVADTTVVLDAQILGKPADEAEARSMLRALSGREVMVHPMTIRDPGQVEGLFDAVWERFGSIDVLVNNAGGQFAAHAMDFTDKGWNAVIDTNLNGTWYMMQNAARRWVAQAKRDTSIVTIAAAVWLRAS